jgi:hypothetical protein
MKLATKEHRDRKETDGARFENLLRSLRSLAANNSALFP